MKKLAQLTALCASAILCLMGILVWGARVVPFSSEEELAFTKNFPAFQYQGINIRYKTQGDPTKPAIVFVHGLGSSLFSWRRQWDALSRDYYMIALDLPGFGTSDRPQTPDFYDMKELSGAVNAVLEHLGVKRAHVVGHSLGGAISLRFARNYPEKTRSLTLIDSAGYYSQVPLALRMSTYLWDVSKPFLGRWMIQGLLYDVAYNTSVVTDEAIEGYLLPLRMSGNFGLPHVVVKIESLAEKIKTEEPYISSLQVPTLIVWGRKDSWIDLSFGERFHNEIKNSSLIIYDDAGHIPHEEYPEKFNSDLLEFLQRTENGLTYLKP
jgi:pimeloyl-ACP methyl ester carboxylesterase